MHFAEKFSRAEVARRRTYLQSLHSPESGILVSSGSCIHAESSSVNTSGGAGDLRQCGDGRHHRPPQGPVLSGQVGKVVQGDLVGDRVVPTVTVGPGEMRSGGQEV